MLGVKFPCGLLFHVVIGNVGTKGSVREGERERNNGMSGEKIEKIRGSGKDLWEPKM